MLTPKNTGLILLDLFIQMDGSSFPLTESNYQGQLQPVREKGIINFLLKIPSKPWYINITNGDLFYIN